MELPLRQYVGSLDAIKFWAIIDKKDNYKIKILHEE